MKTRDIFGTGTEAPGLEITSLEEAPTYHQNLPEMEDVSVEEETPRRPLHGMALASFLALAILGVQCFRLQILEASQHRALAEGNSVRIITKYPERGLITDRNGLVITQNDRKVALTINPQTLPSKRAERAEVYALLQNRLGLKDEEIEQIEDSLGEASGPIALKTNLTKEESLLYWEWFHETPGIQVSDIPIRLYTELPSTGHLLGYVGVASTTDMEQGAARNQLVGKNGLEKQYNTQLSGTPGKLYAEVDAQGEIIRYISDELSVAPQVGKTLRLSIDSKFQAQVGEALKHELERRKKKYGDLPNLGASAVVLDPNTGEVLAMVSYPDYSNAEFAQGISPDAYQKLLTTPGNPLLNRATQGMFAPGSTLKPLVAAAALEEGLITANTSVVTPEAITIGSFRFPDWKYHGQTNTRKAIAESNNIFFYALGGGWKEGGIQGLGMDRLTRYLGQFGLGKKNGIDLPSEASGLVPTEEWKQKQYNESWFIGNTYQTSIGQGYLLSTPLQMATATAAIANGGTVWQPHLAKGFIDSTTQEETAVTPTKLSENFVKPEHIRTVQEGMREAVVSGSARLLNQLKVTSAGKTGTAQFGNQGLTHAWYTGYAPHDNPQIAFAVVIEGGGESFYSSVPTVEELLRSYFNEPVEQGGKLFSEPTDAKAAEIANEFSGER